MLAPRVAAGADACRRNEGVGQPSEPSTAPLHQGEAFGEAVAEDEAAVVRSLESAVQADSPAAEVPNGDAVAAAVA
ncbi:hypothetical protein [Arthrobacter humicola]